MLPSGGVLNRVADVSKYGACKGAALLASDVALSPALHSRRPDFGFRMLEPNIANTSDVDLGAPISA